MTSSHRFLPFTQVRIADEFWTPRQAEQPIQAFLDGDTPYSQMSHPPFTTLAWNLETIADHTTEIVRSIEAGRMFAQPVVRMLAPRLINRR